MLTFVLLAVLVGRMDAYVPVGVGAAAMGRNAGTEFLVGLLGGLLTFGGAYTAIPLIQYEVGNFSMIIILSRITHTQAHTRAHLHVHTPTITSLFISPSPSPRRPSQQVVG